MYCSRLSGIVIIPDEIQQIYPSTFAYCRDLEGVVLPARLETIREGAFENCYQLSSITCNATTPPTLASTAFDGVAKDNFTVEVPEEAVADYTLAAGWKEFKRFAAHRNFSISRNLFRTLNASDSKTLVLRADAGSAWSIESKPDWVTVEPSSGTGKTEVTVTVNELAKGSGNRTGEVVFLLDGKDYRTRTTVEQYDYEYGDGDVITNQTAKVGKGVNLVFMGDCFDAKDIAEGNYLSGVNEAITHFFNVEPYNTYKDYFNVYTVVGLSPDSGMGTVNTIREAKFGSQYAVSSKIEPTAATCFEYAAKTATVSADNICQTLIVLVENTSDYGGITWMYGDGSAIAVCPMSADAYPYDFRGIVQHEAGGHGFGKLADEYIYHNAFVQTCTCNCCSHTDEFLKSKSYGWYDNLALTGNMSAVPWSHMIFDEKYSNTVDIYEGGFFHSRGVFRSESNSCMNNNIPYFSAISRESIVKRIMKYAGETYSYEDFKAKDKGLMTTDSGTDAATSSIRTFGTNGYLTLPSRHQHAPQFMGEHPDLSGLKK